MVSESVKKLQTAELLKKAVENPPML